MISYLIYKEYALSISFQDALKRNEGLRMYILCKEEVKLMDRISLIILIVLKGNSKRPEPPISTITIQFSTNPLMYIFLTTILPIWVAAFKRVVTLSYFMGKYYFQFPHNVQHNVNDWSELMISSKLVDVTLFLCKYFKLITMNSSDSGVNS